MGPQDLCHGDTSGQESSVKGFYIRNAFRPQVALTANDVVTVGESVQFFRIQVEIVDLRYVYAAHWIVKISM